MYRIRGIRLRAAHVEFRRPRFEFYELGGKKRTSTRSANNIFLNVNHVFYRSIEDLQDNVKNVSRHTLVISGVFIGGGETYTIGLVLMCDI